MHHWKALLGVGLGLTPMLAPLLVDPSAAPAMLLHGSLGTFVPMAAMAAIFVVAAKRWRYGTSIDGSASRLAFATRLAVFFAAAFVMTLGAFAAWQYGDYRRTVALQRHGRRENAEVARIYTDGCGRSGCSTAVEYRYAIPSTRSGPTFATGHGTLASGSRHDDPQLLFAKRYGQVPIVYDAKDTGTSSLNFEDRTLRMDAGARLRRFMLLGLFTAVVAGTFALLIAQKAARAKPA